MKRYICITVILLSCSLLFAAGAPEDPSDEMIQAGFSYQFDLGTFPAYGLNFDWMTKDVSGSSSISPGALMRIETFVGDDFSYMKIGAAPCGGMFWNPGEGFFELMLMMGADLSFSWGILNDVPSTEPVFPMYLDLGATFLAGTNFYFGSSRTLGLHLSARGTASFDILPLIAGEFSSRFYASANLSMAIRFPHRK